MFRSFRNRFRANSSTSEEEAQPVHEDAVVEVEEDERGSDEIDDDDSSEGSQDGDNRVHVEYYTHEDRVWRPAVLVIHAGAHGVRVYLRTEGGEVRIALGDDWSREVVDARAGDGARAAFVVRAGDETTVVRARDGNATLRVFARLNAVALEDVERSVEEAQDYSLKAAARTGDRARVAWMRRLSPASRATTADAAALFAAAGVTVTSTNTNLPELNPASHREKRARRPRASRASSTAGPQDHPALRRWRTRAEVSTSAARRDADHVQSLREAVDYTHRVMAKQASAAIVRRALQRYGGKAKMARAWTRWNRRLGEKSLDEGAAAHARRLAELEAELKASHAEELAARDAAHDRDLQDTLRGFEDTRLRLAEQHASELDEWRAAARRATAHEGELEDELARRQADATPRDRCGTQIFNPTSMTRRTTTASARPCAPTRPSGRSAILHEAARTRGPHVAREGPRARDDLEELRESHAADVALAVAEREDALRGDFAEEALELEHQDAAAALAARHENAARVGLEAERAETRGRAASHERSLEALRDARRGAAPSAPPTTLSREAASREAAAAAARDAAAAAEAASRTEHAAALNAATAAQATALKAQHRALDAAPKSSRSAAEAAARDAAARAEASAAAAHDAAIARAVDAHEAQLRSERDRHAGGAERRAREYGEAVKQTSRTSTSSTRRPSRPRTRARPPRRTPRAPRTTTTSR
ncbi:hypothetical protein JL721_8873 [Aureococcus anophagefferens]|nr:hypothetical protein JL721_8873 [Aureococcus anophagefferens]